MWDTEQHAADADEKTARENSNMNKSDINNNEATNEKTAHDNQLNDNDNDNITCCDTDNNNNNNDDEALLWAVAHGGTIGCWVLHHTTHPSHHTNRRGFNSTPLHVIGHTREDVACVSLYACSHRGVLVVGCADGGVLVHPLHVDKVCMMK